MQDSLDLEHLRTWIGRTETADDLVSPRLAAEFQATFGGASLLPGAEAPVGIHWCLAPRLAGMEMLGQDGHPAKGDFLPPVPLPRRMWAGGEATFHAPLRVGDEVRRASHIADVTAKTGRSGALCFVTVRHELSTARGVAITERHDIVYRAAAASGPAVAAAAAVPPKAEQFRSVAAGSVLLFRYSAMTFNGHRIHYDLDYARNVEGYAGLVVHGPLQMTMLLRYGLELRRFPEPFTVSYRGARPLTEQAFTLSAVGEPGGLKLWTAGGDGQPAMEAHLGGGPQRKD